MMIGSVPAPLEWTHWKAAEALLEPARALGGFDAVIEPDEALWAVMDGNELLACATAWLGEGHCEIKLVGGRDHHRWIRELDETVGRAAAEAGALKLTAWGRRGWTKVLRELGWDSFPVDDETNGYFRTIVVQSGNETNPRS